MQHALELNLDGLVGPTHSYAGLSYGNIASQRHRREPSNPRQAALQGLAKMKQLADLGLKQGVLPPQERPDILALRRLGFSGDNARVLEQARQEGPVLLAACCSASGMWAANAATVSPSADTADGRVHFTPANLLTQFHRSLEPQTTAAALRAIFADESAFCHHDPLPAAAPFSDEGAANHTRLAPSHGQRGLEIFVFGKSAFTSALPAPVRFPARQTREASAAIARLHGLRGPDTLLLQQAPAAIDAGAFHNDVVSVGNLNVMLYHESAFAAGADGPSAAEEVRRAYTKATGSEELFLVEAAERQVPLADAVSSYLFNSQLVGLPDGSMTLIAPVECQEVPTAAAFIDQLTQSATPVRTAHFVDVRQSMRNGGGPACLRLRVALTAEQFARMNPGVLLTKSLYEQLCAWVERHYREQLHPDDLADPRLLTESRDALDELTRILRLGPIYRFQRA
jgi:succinylarginine dihydrolase